MACKGFWECLLKLLNFLLMLVGLAMVGYGIYLFVGYQNAASSGGDAPPLPPPSPDVVQLGRPMLLAVSLADNIFDKLPKAWYEETNKLYHAHGSVNVYLMAFWSFRVFFINTFCVVHALDSVKPQKDLVKHQTHGIYWPIDYSEYFELLAIIVEFIAHQTCELNKKIKNSVGLCGK